MSLTYDEFLGTKRHVGSWDGFEPIAVPDALFDFQRALVEWAQRRGRAAIFADCGLGKGQPPSDKVLTPGGWRTIGSLSVGDLVISSLGTSSTIVGVYPKPAQDTYRVYFSDRCSFVVDADHQHICRTNNDRRRGKSWRVMSTRELLASGNIRYGDGGRSRNYDIPVVSPIDFGSSSPLPIAPYLLGVLLGDGHMGGNIVLSSADQFIVDRVSCELREWGATLRRRHAYDWNVITGATGNRRHPFRQALYLLGLLGTRSGSKFVPDIYLFGSVDARLALLRGLMDTDGYVDPGGSCSFYSVSSRLADAVVFVVRSLGGIPTRSLKQTEFGGKAGQPCHVVTFSLATANPFLLPRKAARWNPTPRGNGRWIDRIEFESVQDTVCIAVDSPDQSYVTEHFIVTHNTAMQLVWADNIVRKTNQSVLILTPLAVGAQTLREAEKFGIHAVRSRDGALPPSASIVVANYEQLHKFAPVDFSGVVCDESSILKSYDGETRKAITQFMRTLRYRLLCTATSAPNDYIELGTSSEALGEMGYMDVLTRFFVNDQHSAHPFRKMVESGKWRFKGYAEVPFWRWVCSWARSLRSPADIGFDSSRFVLPPLREVDHVVKVATPRAGQLFTLPARDMREERAERRHTLRERCEYAARLADTSEQAVIWCHLNDEGDLLERLIPDAQQVSGADTDARKEECYAAFADRQIRVLITKPKLGAWGMNWQQCAHVITFATHSYESYYQSVRRCWRFGQSRPVVVDRILSEGETRVLANLQRKSDNADKMFSELVRHMKDALIIHPMNKDSEAIEVPQWV